MDFIQPNLWNVEIPGFSFSHDDQSRTLTTVAFFTEEVNPRLAKRPLKTNGRLANRWSTSLVKEATV